jgi:hypothetical protein
MPHSRTSMIVAALLCALITTSITYAANVRLRARDEPALVDEGLTAAVTAGLAGLAHDDVLVTLKATGVATARCPAERRELTFVTHLLIEAATIVDGAVPFTVRTDLPVAGVPGCPKADVLDIDFTDAFLEVRQPPEAREPLLKSYCNRGGCVPLGT